ncbi:MAG: HEPN domain-containing protein [Candidatus Methanoperedens sp.]
MLDNDEFERWMAQASDTLNSARHDYSYKSYNWCCFKAQQAAEYAVKALLKGLGISAYGHSIVKLLKDLETYSLDVHKLVFYARILDRHYVPARYPDAFTEGSPFEFYDEKTAQEALDCAEKISDFCNTMRMKYE